eukprot:jgi/Antlo1/2568/679
MENALGKLTECIKNKKYHKILHAIDNINKYGDNSHNSNALNIYKEQLCILKMIIANDIQVSLCNGREIPHAIWALVDWLGKDFMMNVGVVALNFLLMRYAEEFRLKTAEIRSIGDVPKHFLWAEKRILEIANIYSNLPEDWCLHGMLTFLFCKETASVLEECCISTFDNNEMWVNAINTCVDFEIKHTKSARCICANTDNFDLGSKSDNPVIMFSGESVEVNAQASPIDSTGIILEITAGQKEKYACLCKSRKSISRVLSRNLAPYIKHLCSDLFLINFDQKDHEMYIIRCFIAFFSILGRVHVRITHFEENTCYSAFNAECDQHLCRYLDKLDVVAEYSQGIIVINSLMFVENTLRDFLRNTVLFADKHHEWGSFNRIKKLEAAQLDQLGKSVERIVMDINIDIYGYFGRHFARALLQTVFAVNTVYVYPELIAFVLSASLSVLLFRISEIKMSVYRAEHILEEVGDIKSELSQLKQKSHVFTTLDMYLKVYLVPPEDVENFVENFILVSESKFVFTQILKRLENTSNNAKLYMCYKSKTKQLELLSRQNIDL